MSSERVLLIEDDLAMYKILAGSFTQLGYELNQAIDGETGLERALSEDFALVVIDANLPRLNGFDVCRKLRDRKQRIPIIMLTSRTEEVDRVIGIELGADDYITKPFSVREFVARVKSLLRRAEHSAASSASANQESFDLPILTFGKLRIDSGTSIVTYGGKKIDLTAVEYKLLLLLATNPGKIFSRDELVSRIWAEEASRFEPTVTVVISRLRTKIEPNPASPRFIHTVRGVGYRFIDTLVDQLP